MGWVSERQLERERLHLVALAQAKEARAAAEARVELLQEERTRLLQRCAELEVDSRRLVDTLVQMRREGFHLGVAPLELPIEPEPELDAEILRACASLAEPGSKLYEELVSDARHMRDHEGLETRAIVQATLRGGAAASFAEVAWNVAQD